MKHICPFSGTEWSSGPSLFQQEKSVDPHPIFRLSRSKLLARGLKWIKQTYNEEEQKLYFLALLRSTEHVIFDCIALPDHQTVSKNTEALLRTVAWLERANPGTLPLTSYRISPLNNQIREVNNWINSWNEIRQEWMQSSVRKQLQDVLESRENRLMKKIYSPTVDIFSYAKTLISWACDASKVPASKKEEWIDLASASEDRLYLFSKKEKQELQACLDYMYINLLTPGSHSAGYGQTLSQKTFELLRKKIEIAEGGRLAALGGDLSLLLEARKSYRFLQAPGGELQDSVNFDFSSIEADLVSLGDAGKYYSTSNHPVYKQQISQQIQDVQAKRSLASKAPEVKPLKENYATLGEFIRAKAAWLAKEAIKEIDNKDKIKEN